MSYSLDEVYTYVPEKPKDFKKEKDTYPYFKRIIGFEEGFKIYSPVLRGLPDFIVTEKRLKEVEAGGFEVKFENNTLRPSQISVLSKLTKVMPIYVVNIYRDGKAIFRRLTLTDD